VCPARSMRMAKMFPVSDIDSRYQQNSCAAGEVK
jgi:hypothetical protein